MSGVAEMALGFNVQASFSCLAKPVCLLKTSLLHWERRKSSADVEEAVWPHEPGCTAGRSGPGVHREACGKFPLLDLNDLAEQQHEVM